MATWPSGLGKGLQSPEPGFDSRRRLQPFASYKAWSEACRARVPVDTGCQSGSVAPMRLMMSPPWWRTRKTRMSLADSWWKTAYGNDAIAR